ncbi:MAG: hypothetical protein IGR92_05175 [Leptolyngbyaceae cyanobacterium T60_A2020_046]|nr:hypothetical protein [Leptolyngbyaceae cyanobacterium T60_A2020_046]
MGGPQPWVNISLVKPWARADEGVVRLGGRSQRFTTGKSSDPEGRSAASPQNTLTAPVYLRVVEHRFCPSSLNVA